MSDDPAHKAVSEIFKNYVVAIAVIVGGGWTVYEFASLERVERTRIERALAETELEQKRRQLLQHRLVASLEADVTPGDAGSFLILGELSNENVSDVRVDVPLEPDLSTLQAVRLRPQRGDDPLVSHRQIWRPRDHRGPITGVTVLPGREIVLPFAFWVDAPGVYLLSFQSELQSEPSPQDEALREQFDIDTFVLGETRLISVGLDGENHQPANPPVEHLQQQ